MDEFAKQEVFNLESYIEDTRHLLELVQTENTLGPQPKEAIPVTMDISGMYNNIPWDEGMQAFQETMDRREVKPVPTSFLMTLLSLVLSCNMFVFN